MKFKSALEGDLRKQFHSISFTQRAGFDWITQLPPGQRTASTVTDTAQVRPCGGLHLPRTGFCTPALGPLCRDACVWTSGGSPRLGAGQWTGPGRLCQGRGSWKLLWWGRLASGLCGPCPWGEQPLRCRLAPGYRAMQSGAISLGQGPASSSGLCLGCACVTWAWARVCNACVPVAGGGGWCCMSVHVCQGLEVQGPMWVPSREVWAATG